MTLAPCPQDRYRLEERFIITRKGHNKDQFNPYERPRSTDSPTPRDRRLDPGWDEGQSDFTGRLRGQCPLGRRSMRLLSIYRPAVSNRKVTLSDAPCRKAAFKWICRYQSERYAAFPTKVSQKSVWNITIPSFSPIPGGSSFHAERLSVNRLNSQR
jgi:hypothetical protein